MNKNLKNLLIALIGILICGLCFYFGVLSVKKSMGATSEYRILKDDGGGYIVPTQTTDRIGSSTVNSYWRHSTTTNDIYFSSLTNCDTIDTDVNGLLSCGTDASGGIADLSTAQLGQIGDVSTSTLAWGHLLMHDGTNWQDVATSSLGIAGAMTYPGAGIALSTGAAWDTSITNNSANWNTAYGWGDHSGAGYLLSADAFTQAIASTTFVDRANWTTIDNYPTGCTNQFIRTIGDTLTCASVANTDLVNSTIGLTSSGSITIGTSPISLGGTSALNLNMANANTWTALQTFGNASTTLISSDYASSTSGYFGSAYLPNLAVAAGTFLAVNGDGLIIATTTPSGGTGITSLGGQTGAIQTFATTSPDANIILTIISAGDVHTFNADWTGTLTAARIGLLDGFTDSLTILGGDRFPFYQDTSGANRDVSWDTLMAEITNTGTLADLSITGLSILSGGASTTLLTVSGDSWFNTIKSGTWNGTAIADAYIADDITASNYLSLTTWFATTTHALISSLPSLSITESQISDLDHYTDADVSTYLTGGAGIEEALGSITFDCSEVEGTGINCVGEAITLDATGDWTGTIDGNNFAGGAVAVGDLLYGSGVGAISELSIGTGGYILAVYNGLPAWIATSSFIMADEIDTYGELNAIVADATLTHNGLIDTYAELDVIVADATLTHNGLIDTFAELDAIVADKALVNKADGAVWLGVHDFGGATSLELPNGAPTLNSTGQIGFDTTDNQILIATSTNSVSAVIPTKIKLFSGGLASTSPDFINGGRIFTTPQRDGFIVREIHCIADAGTSVVINLSNSAGTTDSETITCTTAGASDTSIDTNATYAAGSFNSVEIGAIVGSPDYFTYSVYGVIQPE